MATRTLNQINAEIRELEAKAAERLEELDRLADKETLTPGENTRFDNLTTGVRRMTADLEKLKAERQGVAVDDFRSGRVTTEHGDDRNGAPHFMKRNRSFDVDPNASNNEVRSQALTVVEEWEAPDDFKAGATKMLEGRNLERGVGEHVIKYSDPDYIDAYRAMMEDPDGGGAILTDRQRSLWRDSRMEARATLQTSGAVLPSPLDPTINLSSAGLEGSIRAVASVHQTASNTWQGITSAGVSAAFAAEAAEVADGTPALTGTTITTRKMHGMAIFTIEAGMDQPDFVEQLGRLIADEKVLTEEPTFWNGAAGSNQPVGIWTAIDGGAYEITPTTSETLGAPDVYKVVEGVGPRFRNRGARFQMERSTYHHLWQQFNPSGTDAPLFLDGQLIGFPYDLNSSIDAYADINVATTTDNPVIAFGDFKGYHIADRVGLVTTTPQLLQNSGNMRYDGTLGVYWYARVGGDILVDGSIAVLNVATVGA